jgi:hypothetical protein
MEKDDKIAAAPVRGGRCPLPFGRQIAKWLKTVAFSTCPGGESVFLEPVSSMLIIGFRKSHVPR